MAGNSRLPPAMGYPHVLYPMRMPLTPQAYQQQQHMRAMFPVVTPAMGGGTPGAGSNAWYSQLLAISASNPAHDLRVTMAPFPQVLLKADGTADETSSTTLVLENARTAHPVMVASMQVMSHKEYITWPCHALPAHIEPGATVRITLTFRPRTAGNSPLLGPLSTALALTLLLPQQWRPFAPEIRLQTVTVKGYVCDEALRKALDPKAKPFLPAGLRDAASKPIASTQLHCFPAHIAAKHATLPGVLPLAPLSAILAELTGRASSAPPRDASLQTWAHYCVEMEELENQAAVQRLTILAATITSPRTIDGRHYCTLVVPDLSDNRPLVCLGDELQLRWFILERLAVQGAIKALVGIVHALEKDSVVLYLPVPLHSVIQKKEGPRYSVVAQFQHDAFAFYLMKMACEVPLPANLLEPTAADAEALDPVVPEAKFWPQRQGLNQSQIDAVNSVLSRSKGYRNVPPLLIWGPPGTGKTSTVVESVWQVLRLYPDSRILVTAPSNAAADVVAKRFLALGFTAGDMLRLNWRRRPVATLPAELLKVSPAEGGTFCVPPLEELLHVKVVVCTCLATHMLTENGVPKGHFTHIFMDEAAQAMEPESYVPLALAGDACAVILTGDPCQLGPVVRTCFPEVAKWLSTSYMERLMALPCYREGGAQLMVRLRENYRSQPRILELSASLFYNNDLHPAAKPEEVESLTSWRELPAHASFPLLFFGVDGECERRDESQAVYNVAEAVAVRDLILRLLEETDLKVSSGDFGVLAPYRKQVDILRKVLRASRLDAVRVGTVDDYQGQEERIVIISTTVTPGALMELEEFAKQLPSSFLDNAKRFNVAVTRAKALLIVVGHPLALQKDPYWSKLMTFCDANEAYRGYRPVGNDGGQIALAMDSVVRRVRATGVLGQAAQNPWQPNLEDLRSHFQDELEFRVSL